jgi:hypothetical protein
MQKTIPTPAAALAALLVLTAPLAAQERAGHASEHHTVRTHGGREHRSVEVRVSGRVDVNEAGDWVENVSPGGHVWLQERAGGTTRRLEFTRPSGGALRTRYWLNGREQALDDEGRAWARARIREEVRGGLGARERVERIRTRRGVQGVLDEAAGVHTDRARRTYYTALLDGAPLSGGEFARVVADAGRRMRSDAELRLLLAQAAGDATDAPRAAAVAEATRGIRSDVERRLVLAQLARGGLPGDAQPAFFSAVEAMRSDLERRLILSTLLDHATSESVSAAAVRSAAAMRSDVEKRLVLSRIPAAHLHSRRVQDALQHTVGTMRSDVERALVLRRLTGEEVR